MNATKRKKSEMWNETQAKPSNQINFECANIEIGRSLRWTVAVLLSTRSFWLQHFYVRTIFFIIFLSSQLQFVFISRDGFSLFSIFFLCFGIRFFFLLLFFAIIYVASYRWSNEICFCLSVVRFFLLFARLFYVGVFLFFAFDNLLPKEINGNFSRKRFQFMNLFFGLQSTH